jgi:hypothetical protein
MLCSACDLKDEFLFVILNNILKLFKNWEDLDVGGRIILEWILER